MHNYRSATFEASCGWVASGGFRSEMVPIFEKALRISLIISGWGRWVWNLLPAVGVHAWVDGSTGVLNGQAGPPEEGVLRKDVRAPHQPREVTLLQGGPPLPRNFISFVKKDF